MPNEFCRFLSNGYRFRAQGNDILYSPCCWFRKEISIYSDDFDLQKQHISKIDQWTPECGACHTIERSGVYGEHTPRNRSFREIPDDSVPDHVPVWLELTIDDTCNAACVICGPWHSTTWQKQEVKFGIIESVPLKRTASDFLTDLRSRFDFTHVRSVSFLGGEPFQSKIPLEICKLLQDINGSLENIDLHFQTNGSVLPEPELLTLIQTAGKLRFNFSIDGVDDRFEWLRYPLQWSKVLKVIEQLKLLSSPRVFYTVLTTLNPFNCLYYNEVAEWAQSTFQSVKYMPIKPNRAGGRMDLAYTPRNLRRQIYEKYGLAHPVSRMLLNLNYRSDTNFLEFVNWLDTNRRLNWQKVFPEVASLFG